MYKWCVLKDNVKISKDIVDSYRTMFESRISAVSTPYIDDHHFKQDEMKSLENVHKYGLKLF